MKKLTTTITVLAMAGAAQVASATSYSDAVSALSPAGYWEFEDNYNDASGNGNTLTGFGSSSGFDDGPGLPGNPGRAFSVQHDGGQSGASVALGAGNPLNLAGATAYTINTWVKNRDKYNQNNNGFLVVNRDADWASSSGANYGLSTSHSSDGRMRAWSSANYNRREFSPLTGYSHDWQMLTATITLNGGSADFYRNGVLIGSDSSALHHTITSITGDGVVFAVGNRCDGSGCGSDDYDGLIDGLAIFGSALSGPEIAGLYAAAQVPEPTTLALLALGSLAFLRNRRRG